MRRGILRRLPKSDVALTEAMETRTMFDKSKVFVGITPTVWTNDDMPLLGNDSCTFEQIIDEMALAGFEGCSIGHKYPTDTGVLRRELGRRGLRVSEPWVGLYFAAKEMHDQTVAKFRKQMDFIKSMGGTDVVVAELTQAVHQAAVSAIPNKPVFDDVQWKALVDGLDEIGALAVDNGMRLAYHPHVGTGIMTLRVSTSPSPLCSRERFDGSRSCDHRHPSEAFPIQTIGEASSQPN
jgi:inosose dehydratase